MELNGREEEDGPKLGQADGLFLWSLPDGVPGHLGVKEERPATGRDSQAHRRVQ
jgi:hypothetical protein